MNREKEKPDFCQQNKSRGTIGFDGKTKGGVIEEEKKHERKEFVRRDDSEK